MSGCDGLAAGFQLCVACCCCERKVEREAREREREGRRLQARQSIGQTPAIVVMFRWENSDCQTIIIKTRRNEAVCCDGTLMLAWQDRASSPLASRRRPWSGAADLGSLWPASTAHQSGASPKFPHRNHPIATCIPLITSHTPPPPHDIARGRSHQPRVEPDITTTR